MEGRSLATTTESDTCGIGSPRTNSQLLAGLFRSSQVLKWKLDIKVQHSKLDLLGYHSVWSRDERWYIDDYLVKLLFCSLSLGISRTSRSIFCGFSNVQYRDSEIGHFLVFSNPSCSNSLLLYIKV